ncbi:MAG: hypothetical protein OSJ45_13660 [Lachnospiraceae bacterium]|nr:hypothetical protein [Lachnospiraceae bacterium]
MNKEVSKCSSCVWSKNKSGSDCRYSCKGINAVTEPGKIVLSCDGYEEQIKKCEAGFKNSFMVENTERQKNEKRLLKEYLGQYYTSRIKRLQLERRLKSIREEMDAPVGGYGYSPVNYRGTNKVEAGAASFVYRISEIETRIEEQRSQTEKALLKVMDIIDFLDEDSTERMVLELRFIDCKSFAAMGKEVHLSRSSLFFYQDKGLEKLMACKKVHQILMEYKKIM